MKQNRLFLGLGSLSLAALLLAGCGTTQQTASDSSAVLPNTGSAAAAQEGSVQTNAQTDVQADTQTTSSDYIGEDNAASIARKDAGLKQSELSSLTVVLEDETDESDPAVYDVEFISGSTEYEYEIDALTGSIVSRDTDTAHAQSAAQSGDLISEASAKKAALQHAGLSERDVTSLTIHLDQDDGSAEYEVEFLVGSTEYSYDINAVSGEIIAYDVDQDHD